MNLDVLKADGKGKATALEVADEVFGMPFNEALVHQVVTAYLAGGRQGTRAQKSRSDVSGGGRKPWRQKGTGRARAGTIRSPIWRSGGVTFPSSTQDFSQKVNRKMYRGAMCSILSELGREGRLVVLEELSVAEPKTRHLNAALSAVGATDALLVIEGEDRNLELAARNLPRVTVTRPEGVDPVSLIAYEKVVVSAGALRKIEERLA